MSNRQPKSFSRSDDSSSTSDGDKSQRFTDDILNKPTRSTAKRHSFSMSPTIERQDSNDATRFIPGAYPTSEKQDGFNSSRLAGLHGSRVGTGFMLDEDSKPFANSQLPTTEQPSGSRVGVGSLPGNIKESGVALLPEERIHPDPYLGGSLNHKSHRREDTNQTYEDQLPTHEHPSGSKVGVGSLPGSNREAGVAILPEERINTDPMVGPVGPFQSKPKGRHSRHTKHADDDELPTHEHPSGSRVGVGSLPGSNREVGVAILPEERIHPDPIVGGVDPMEWPANKGHHSQMAHENELPTHEHPSGSQVGVGSLPGSNRETGVAILPEERIHPDPIVGRVDVSGYSNERTFHKPHPTRRHHDKKMNASPADNSELPTHEHPSGSKVGVGSLPGSNREVGVAILPEERIHPDPIVGAVTGSVRPTKHKGHSYSKTHHAGRMDFGSQLPTREHPSGSRVGIGSMPGGVHEPGVATLPEERMDGRPYGSGHTGFEGHLGPEHPSHPSRKKQTTKRAERKNMPKSQFKAELPTTEQPSGSRVGIGSMPGSIREAGVATLPEERIDGRPYGSGHTGFEDMLGHGHTFRQSHPKENVSKPMRKTSKIVVDDNARRSLAEQNPCISPPRPKQDSSSEQLHQGLPGDTIFSATQRALKQDPTFIHGSLGTGLLGENNSITIKSQQNTGTAKNPRKYGDRGSQQPAPSNGTSVIETMEGAAMEAMHGAEHILHNIEEGAKAYVPRGFSSYFAGTTTNVTASGTQDRQGPDERSSGQANARHPQFSNVIPEDEDITDAIHKGRISGTQSKLPPFIKREYHKSPKYDLHGDKLDFGQFVYDDDISYDDESAVSSNIPSERQSPDPQRERNLASDRARGDYTTGDAKPQSTANEDADNIQYGYGGVGFNLAGKDGILPGYPTREGMNKLISERMRDDRLRASGVVNPSKSRFNLPAPSGVAMRGPSTEIVTTDAGDYDLSSRYIEEKQEIPIFEGGGIAASGKFEAVFETGSVRVEQGRRAENPASKDAPEKLNAKLGAANVGGAFSSKGGMKVGYLGKPLSQDQEEIEIERARRDAVRKMGID